MLCWQFNTSGKQKADQGERKERYTACIHRLDRQDDLMTALDFFQTELRRRWMRDWRSRVVEKWAEVRGTEKEGGGGTSGMGVGRENESRDVPLLLGLS
jgi:hypothetical protein